MKIMLLRFLFVPLFLFHFAAKYLPVVGPEARLLSIFCYQKTDEKSIGGIVDIVLVIAVLLFVSFPRC